MSERKVMPRRCRECKSVLIHHPGSSTWECPRSTCWVSHQTFKRYGFNTFKVDRIVYVAAL